MKTSTFILPIVATTLSFLAGFLFGASAAIDLYKREAVQHQAARWVIEDQAKGTTRFEWINPEVEK